MSFGSPLAEGRLLAKHLARLQVEKQALASQNAELVRAARALSERCELLEAAACCEPEEDTPLTRCGFDERTAHLEAQLADCVARLGDAEARAASSNEHAAASVVRLTAAEAHNADLEARQEEVVSALMEARTALAQSRFEHDEASLAHRRRVAELSLQLTRLQELQLADCTRVATLEVQLAECERSKAALARECAARRHESEANAKAAARKPLSELASNGAAGPTTGSSLRAWAERLQEW